MRDASPPNLAQRPVCSMKLTMKWILMTGMAPLLGGCAALPALTGVSLLPTGSASADLHSATTVKLEQSNFTMVKANAVGQSKGFALLGLITIVPARFSTAMDRLYEHAELRPGRAQTLANVVAERSSTYLVLYSIPRVSIRADVVEFVAPPPPLTIPSQRTDPPSSLPPR